MPVIDPKKIAQAAEIVASGEFAGEGYWRETVRALLAERESLNQEMLALLREVEANMAEWGYPCICRESRFMENEIHHAPDCRLAAFLRTA
jgi:hypothetical protein